MDGEQRLRCRQYAQHHRNGRGRSLMGIRRTLGASLENALDDGSLPAGGHGFSPGKRALARYAEITDTTDKTPARHTMMLLWNRRASRAIDGRFSRPCG